jgi:hypothetical protein
VLAGNPRNDKEFSERTEDEVWAMTLDNEDDGEEEEGEVVQED